MVNSLRVINQQQNSSFVYWKQSWDRVSIRRAVGLGVEIPVCEEPLEKEKKGKADFLECRPKQHRVPQKAELDTRCVCRKFSSGTCISRNWSGRRESKTKVGYQAKHCGNWGSVLQGALRELCGIHLQIGYQEDKQEKLCINFLLPLVKSCPGRCSWTCISRIVHASEQLNGFQKAS